MNDNKKRRLQLIGEARWWAKEAALHKIFQSYGLSYSSLYVEVLLSTIVRSKCMNADVRSTVQTLCDAWQKYEVLLISHLF